MLREIRTTADSNVSERSSTGFYALALCLGHIPRKTILEIVGSIQVLFPWSTTCHCGREQALVLVLANPQPGDGCSSRRIVMISWVVNSLLLPSDMTLKHRSGKAIATPVAIHIHTRYQLVGIAMAPHPFFHCLPSLLFPTSLSPFS